MNFLALVNRTRRECGVSSSALSSFSGLSVEDARVKEWVSEAWHDVQLHRADWNWMRKPVSFQTVAAQRSYTAAQAGVTDLGDWKRDSFRVYLTASGVVDEQFMPHVDYESFRNIYQFGATSSEPSRPRVFTVNPTDKQLVLAPIPDAVYTVVGEQYHTVTDLVDTTDDPSSAANGLDARFHMLIVYKAMAAYASYEAAPEVLQRADTESRRLMNRLEFDQLPPITFGPPLA